MRNVVIAGALVALLGCTNAEPARSDAQGSPSVGEVRIGLESFEAPTELSSGYVTIRLVNSTDELHSAHLVRLVDGKTLQDLVEEYGAAIRAGNERPGWLSHVGGPVSARGVAELGVVLEPGRYAWICVMGEDELGGAHFEGHEAQVLVVTSTPASVLPPNPPITITLGDGPPELSDAFAAGPISLEIRNSSEKPHLFAVSRLLPGATADDVVDWMQSFEGPPPAEGVFGTTVVDPDRSVWAALDLSPGRYVIYCYANYEGEPHLAGGEWLEVTVDG